MGYNKKKWEKIDGCECFKCREVEIKVECTKEKEECACNKCKELNVNVFCNNDQHNDKKHDECNKCKGPQNKIEFKSDTSWEDGEVKDYPKSILEVEFSKICPGDKIWFSGIVGFDNQTYNSDAEIELTIVRKTPFGEPKQIYKQIFEIDKEGHDDLTQVPFAHVAYEDNEKCDVTYTVKVERKNGSNDVYFFGQHTLTALRIS